MKFQAIFFVLFALASSFLSMVAVVSGQDSNSSTTMTTTASSNDTFRTTLAPIYEWNNITLEMPNNTDPGPNNSTSPTTVAVATPTTTVLTTSTSPINVTSGTGTENGTDSYNSTEEPPQNFVLNVTTTTTTQAPKGGNQTCFDSWVSRPRGDNFCLKKDFENITECEDKEQKILLNYYCSLLEVSNSTGQNVSDQCIAQVTKCLFEGAGSPPEDMKRHFCVKDKETNVCFTQSLNSSSDCLDKEYQIIRKVSDCSSSRRVAEVCTLIVLLASVVALALTSE